MCQSSPMMAFCEERISRESARRKFTNETEVVCRMTEHVTQHNGQDGSRCKTGAGLFGFFSCVCQWCAGPDLVARQVMTILLVIPIFLNTLWLCNYISFFDGFWYYYQVRSQQWRKQWPWQVTIVWACWLIYKLCVKNWSNPSIAIEENIINHEEVGKTNSSKSWTRQSLSQGLVQIFFYQQWILVILVDMLIKGRKHF